jgi:outer membrane protein
MSMRPRSRHAHRVVATVASAVALSALASGAVRAETLTDAWRMALERDAAVAAARSDREAADADRAAASRARFPVVDVSGAYSRINAVPSLDVGTPIGRLSAPLFRDDTFAMGTADVSIPLFTSGRISGAIGAAKAGAAGAAAMETRTVADTKLAVTEAFVGVLRARHALDAATSGVESLEAHLHDVQVMYDREAVAQTDLLAVQVALANARQQKLRAENGLRIASAAYNRRVGQPMNRALELETPTAPPPTSESLDRLVAVAQERRPELAALAAQRDAYAQSSTMERASMLPQLVLRAGWQHMDNAILDRQDFSTVGIAFQWRLFDSGQAHARVAALRSRARAADQRLADARSLIALDVESEYLNQADALARVGVGRSAVAQAEENLRIAKELYGSGLGTNTQVLDAEALRITALRNREDALLDQLVAAYRLQRASGEL